LKIDKHVKDLSRRLDTFSGSWYWHESSWYWRGVNGYDGYGCNNGKCISECRFYPEYGRIEDEVIEEHNKVVESYRQKNAIVELPSEAVLSRLAKIYRFT